MGNVKLWDTFDGEPFLDNPHLAILANPSKRGTKKMAKRRMPRRDSKGRFIKRASAGSTRKRRTTTRRKRTYRRNPVAAAANPRRRRRSYSAPKRTRTRRRRSYRRNPAMGLKQIFAKPTLKTVGFAVIGFAGTPMLTGFINRFLPANIVGNRWGGYAVKAGSAWALSLAASMVANKEAQRAVLVGGLAYTAMGIIQDFFPVLLGGTAPATEGAGRYLAAAGKQPLLAGARGMGEYMRPGTMGGSITATTASRLDPGNRF